VVVEIRVLGPIEVIRDGAPVAVGGRNQRAALAALVLSLNRAVSTDTLALVVWGDEPPPSAHATLQTYVSHLRAVCGDVIRFGDDCYTLAMEPQHVDLVAFERLVMEARRAITADPERARTCAVEAMALWRGDPFGVLSDDEFIAVEAHRLDELRLEVMELRLEADIALGQCDAAIGHLEAAVEEHPFRERLWYLLMVALSRTGRRVEALRAYQRLRGLLAEIGLEPSQELRELEGDIITEAPAVRSHLQRID
jgi:DNA-binding SARP family transcriptional activator